MTELETGGGQGYLRIATEEAFCPLPFWLYRLDYMHAATVRAKRY